MAMVDTPVTLPGTGYWLLVASALRGRAGDSLVWERRALPGVVTPQHGDFQAQQLQWGIVASHFPVLFQVLPLALLSFIRHTHMEQKWPQTSISSS